MNLQNTHKRTICLCRQGIAGAGGTHYYQQMYALFEELIDKPWGIERWNPVVDIWEKPVAFVIEVDVPGLRPDNISITADENTLVIKGWRQTQPSASDYVVECRERPEGAFSRSFLFNYTIETEHIEHWMQDGVLSVVVPKPEHEREEHDEQERRQRE